MDESRKSTPVERKIIDYIRNDFKEGFLMEIKRISESGGQNVYHVEVSQDNNLYNLDFNANGVLIKSEIEPTYLASNHDDYPEL
ncbi:MAG: hypothetical protein EYC69_08245 [Bacteroidetes bacterium]|nr:MAG: hypothetical protein EYC69_08245 [Bacteroidota bacterium]